MSILDNEGHDPNGLGNTRRYPEPPYDKGDDATVALAVELTKRDEKIKRLRAALETAPRPNPSADPVEYMDWFFKVRGTALSSR